MILQAMQAVPLVVSALGASTELAFLKADIPTITRAIDLVIDSTPKTITVGDDLVLTQRSTPGAGTIRGAGFQVRVFSLNSPQADPMPVGSPIEACLVYYSTVFPVSPSPNPKIRVLWSVSEGWLNLSANKQSITNGHYLLVFEMTGDTGQVFRIRQADSAKYFATGIRLLVEDDQKTSLQSVLDSYAERERRRLGLDAEFKKNDAATPCYSYKAQPVQVAQLGLVALSRCSDDL